MEQQDLIETAEARSLVSELLDDSRLYIRSKDYKELLDFVVRLRSFAPFNAMLLQLQKPGLSYAASAKDWRERFGRTIREGARPLLILRPFGPIALVYDVMDTEGATLPRDVSIFYACGPIGEARVRSFVPIVAKNGIEWCWVDAGDRSAGAIRVVRSGDGDEEARYSMSINRNHSPATQFGTLVHELGHLFLGHLGPNSKLKIPPRMISGHSQMEIEAESVSYLVCKRNNVETTSEAYLANYVTEHVTIEHVDIYHVLRAAGHIEALLGLSAQTKTDVDAR